LPSTHRSNYTSPRNVWIPWDGSLLQSSPRRRFLASSLRGIYSHSCRSTSFFNEPGHVVYTIGQINTYPLGIYALQIVTSGHHFYLGDSHGLMSAFSTSVCLVERRRYASLATNTFIPQIWSLITYAVLAAMPVLLHLAGGPSITL